MKKLFTLVALLAVFMGAKAEWVEDYSIDYATKNNFPFYVMGYVPEWVDGVMTDYGASYRYATQDVLDNGDAQGNGKLEADESIVGTVMAGSTEYQKVTGKTYWHQYFIADGIQTELDGSYTVKAMVKASEAVTINVNMGWGWGQGQSVAADVAIGTEWAEVEWEYSGIGGTSCNMVAQPGNSTATIEWKWVKVSHNAKPSKPTVWQQWLTNDGNSIIPEVAHTNKYVGDAETAWPAWALETTDGINANWRGEQPNLICAWALTMGKNFDDQCPAEVSKDSYRARPFPADIELETGTTNHVFAVHVTQIDVIDAPEPDANSVAWSNQFWIESPKGWKEGEQVRIKFRYKADHACKVGTQIHKQRPSDYLHYEAVGDVSFTTEWQLFEKVVTFSSAQAGGFSLAFNLCSDADNGRTPNVFYFDDLSWETMKLDEGLFVAGANTEGGLQYDFDNAIEFTYDEDEELFTATIGDKDDESTWVNEVMISTVRGNDAAFKSKTLKPTSIKNDPDDWPTYTESSLAKLKLPGTGAWTISIDTAQVQMNFVMIAGEAKEPLDVVTNDTPITVNGQERDDLKDSKNNEGVITVREEADDPDGVNVGGPGHNGEAWDNQFFIKANREIKSGENVTLKFKYKASKEAKTTTQLHNAPGAYVFWNALGDVNFTTEWQNFEKTWEIPTDGGKAISFMSIAFNMAEIKDACVYEVKDVQWYLNDASLDEGKTWENLIDATGDKNFYIKEGAGTSPYIPSGIFDVINDATTRTDVIYNLSGQRVSKDYKGIVIMNGRKVVNK